MWLCLDERVRTTTPPLCFHDCPIRRPNGPVLPGRAQTRQEELDGLLSCGGLPDRPHICERGKAFLRRADVAQQYDGVETRVALLKASANFVRRAHVTGQPLMRRRRRAVGLAHARAVATFRDELE